MEIVIRASADLPHESLIWRQWIPHETVILARLPPMKSHPEWRTIEPPAHVLYPTKDSVETTHNRTESLQQNLPIFKSSNLPIF